MEKGLLILSLKSPVGKIRHYRLSHAVDLHKSVPLELHHPSQLLGNPGLSDALVHSIRPSTRTLGPSAGAQ